MNLTSKPIHHSFIYTFVLQLVFVLKWLKCGVNTFGFSFAKLTSQFSSDGDRTFFKVLLYKYRLSVLSCYFIAYSGQYTSTFIFLTKQKYIDLLIWYYFFAYSKSWPTLTLRSSSYLVCYSSANSEACTDHDNIRV